MVDANYTDSDTTEYLGKVSYTDDEYAEENGDVEIDQYADEVKNDDEFDKWATNQSNLEDSIQLEIDSESEK
jgi:hypothetical protein